MAGHLFASRERLVFAHRGGAKLAPENTMAAFANGLALGSDGIECDVHLSRDGAAVVIHDGTLDRTTDASGAVGARTVDEPARVDVWVVDSAEDMRRLSAWGVDGVITDRPDVAVATRNAIFHVDRGLHSQR